MRTSCSTRFAAPSSVPRLKPAQGGAAVPRRGSAWSRDISSYIIAPYYLTRRDHRLRGSWNASIVPDASSGRIGRSSRSAWGPISRRATDKGDFPRIVLSVAMMSMFVTLFVRLFWRRPMAMPSGDCASDPSSSGVGPCWTPVPPRCSTWPTSARLRQRVRRSADGRLSDVSMRLKIGEIVALLGRSDAANRLC